MHIAIQEREEITIDLIRKTQIKDQSDAKIKAQSKAQVRALLFDKASIVISVKYFNYSNVCLAENVAEFLEYTKINDQAIELEDGKQPLFVQIYSL